MHDNFFFLLLVLSLKLGIMSETQSSEVIFKVKNRNSSQVMYETIFFIARVTWVYSSTTDDAARTLQVQTAFTLSNNFSFLQNLFTL